MSRDDKDLTVHLPLFANNVSFIRKPITQHFGKDGEKTEAGYSIELTAITLCGYDANGNRVFVNILPMADKLVVMDLEAQIAEWYE